MLPEQQRCSTVVVTAAGGGADPGCGAGVRGSRGMRESCDMAAAPLFAFGYGGDTTTLHGRRSYLSRATQRA